LLEDRLNGCVGVKRSTHPELYNLILDEMAELGVKFSEQGRLLSYSIIPL
jgi:hypothetical protein